MREIEYRIWDNTNKKMIYHSSVSSKLICMTITGKFYENGKLLDWIPLQYAENEDKNDKKIYDRDIYKWGNEIGLIVFEKGCFQCKTKYNIFILKSMIENLEVIGNEFENSELLKEEKDE